MIAARLSRYGDAELSVLLRTASEHGAGVGGGSSTLDVDGVPVFVKRIPITDRELAHPHDTANLFDLPARHQYGMYRLPAPTFNAWRELALSPRLHHWRVLPGRPPVAAEHRDIDAVVAQFGGDPAIRARLEALAAATASLVLFSEYLPDGLPRWLSDPVTNAAAVERQLFALVDSLRERRLLHLDAHFGNIRADDDRLYLVDFGLATSPDFDLSGPERDFVASHGGHDADYASMRLVNWLVTTVCGAPAAPLARNRFIRDGRLPAGVPEQVADIVARHAPTASRMNDFCARLYDGDLTAVYPG
ncbi:phosphotransferase [Actinoplanes rectilineatus]|uniref:phosphotransferase n=1 Tax=Actinoplanes rectilineatus TaxID=113571 RepID=UPI000698D763|nr:phosphotransferase [Actinoplanes rectilineatus]